MNTSVNENRSQIDRKITSSVSAMIEGKLAEVESPLFAINWFDTRIALVYHFYNWLAASRVFKIGGRVFFKGKNLRSISGDESLARKFLLIVNYPSGHAFLDLLSDRIFQVMSVFRVLAVKRFSFVLQKRIGEPQLLSEQIPVLKGPAKSYAVFHFVGTDRSQLDSTKQHLARIALAHACEMAFFGFESGRVATAGVNSEPNFLGYVTPTTLLFSAATHADLLKFFKSVEFEDFAQQADNHYAALINRVM